MASIIAKLNEINELNWYPKLPQEKAEAEMRKHFASFNHHETTTERRIVNVHGLVDLHIELRLLGNPATSTIDAIVLQLNESKLTGEGVRDLVMNSLRDPPVQGPLARCSPLLEKLEGFKTNDEIGTLRQLGVKLYVDKAEQFWTKFEKGKVNAGYETLQIISCRYSVQIIVIDEQKGLQYVKFGGSQLRFAFLFCKSTVGKQMALERCHSVINIF